MGYCDTLPVLRILSMPPLLLVKGTKGRLLMNVLCNIRAKDEKKKKNNCTLPTIGRNVPKNQGFQKISGSADEVKNRLLTPFFLSRTDAKLNMLCVILQNLYHFASVGGGMPRNKKKGIIPKIFWTFLFTDFVHRFR